MLQYELIREYVHSTLASQYIYLLSNKVITYTPKYKVYILKNLLRTILLDLVKSICKYNQVTERINRGSVLHSDAGRWKTLGGPVVIGGDNLPFPVGIGLTDLPNIGGPVAPLAPPVPASLCVHNSTIDHFEFVQKGKQKLWNFENK
jgi:hypothetical protein